MAVGTPAAETEEVTATGTAMAVRVPPGTVLAALAAVLATVSVAATAVTVAVLAAAEPAVLAVPVLAVPATAVELEFPAVPVVRVAAAPVLVQGPVAAGTAEVMPAERAAAVRQAVMVARAQAPVLPGLEAPMACASLKAMALRMRVSHPPRLPRHTGFYLAVFAREQPF